MYRLLALLSCLGGVTAQAVTFTSGLPATALDARLLVPPGNSNIVYVDAPPGLYRSDDGGMTFHFRNRVSAGAVDPTNPETLYTTGGARSIDGGTTFVPPQGLPSLLLPRKLLVGWKNPSKLVMASDCGSRLANAGGVYSSEDGGQTWRGDLIGTCVTDGAIDPLSDRTYLLVRNSYYQAYQPYDQPAHQLVASASHPDVRYGIGYATVGLYASGDLVLLVSHEDGPWQRLSPAGLDGYVYDLALDDRSGRLFIATSKGLYVLAPGAAQCTRVPGLGPVIVAQVEIRGDDVYVNTTEGMFRGPVSTLAPFVPLGPIENNGGRQVSRLAADPRSGVLYGAGAGVWRSTDSGDHWEWIAGDDDGGPLTVDDAGDLYIVRAEWGLGDIEKLVASPGRPGVLFTSTLQKSVDGGKTWMYAGPAGNPKTVAVDPDRVGLVYAGMQDGIWVSVDEGGTWKHIGSGDTTEIAVAGSRLYRIVAGEEVQSSDDGGATWRQLTKPGPSASAWAHMAAEPRDVNSVWISGDLGLRHSADGGVTWADLSTSQHSGPSGEILIDRDGKRLHVIWNGEWDAVLHDDHRRAVRH